MTKSAKGSLEKGLRTQNESKKRGGQPRNGNAKKSLVWLKDYDLSSAEGTRKFLQELIKRTWTGELGTRAAGALNGSLRLLLEHEVLPGLEKRISTLEAKTQ
jgi:hypothetical protein